MFGENKMNLIDIIIIGSLAVFFITFCLCIYYADKLEDSLEELYEKLKKFK